MTKDEAMRMAIDAYNKFDYSRFPTVKALEAAILELRTALTQLDAQIGITYEEANPPQPYCKRCGKKLGTEVTDIHTCTPKFDGCDCDSPAWCNQYKKCHRTMLGFEPYVAPSKKEWVGLTDEERIDCEIRAEHNWVLFADIIEAKLKEKNDAY